MNVCNPTNFLMLLIKSFVSLVYLLNFNLPPKLFHIILALVILYTSVIYLDILLELISLVISSLFFFHLKKFLLNTAVLSSSYLSIIIVNNSSILLFFFDSICSHLVISLAISFHCFNFILRILSMKYFLKGNSLETKLPLIHSLYLSKNSFFVTFIFSCKK